MWKNVIIKVCAFVGLGQMHVGGMLWRLSDAFLAFTCVIEDGRGILSKSSLHCSPLHWHCLAYLTTSYSLQLVSYHLQGIGVWTRASWPILPKTFLHCNTALLRPPSTALGNNALGSCSRKQKSQNCLRFASTINILIYTKEWLVECDCSWPNSIVALRTCLRGCQGHKCFSHAVWWIAWLLSA